MAYATGRCMCQPVIGHSFEPDYVVSMVRKVFAGRVEFHDGAGEVAPGVTVHHIGGSHTKDCNACVLKRSAGRSLSRPMRRISMRISTATVCFPWSITLPTCSEGYRHAGEAGRYG